MPFQIIRNDITKVKADIIVNTANPRPVIGAGTDSAIYKAAGEKSLLSERTKIGEIARGDIAVTPALKLDAKYIIHAVGPVWKGGEYGEFDILRDCYRKSLEKTVELKCESIAFPLMATGSYGFPKDKALQIAINEISTFLLGADAEITVFLVVFGSNAFRLSKNLFFQVESFVEDEDVKKAYYEEYNLDPESYHTYGNNVRRRNERFFETECESVSVVPKAKSSFNEKTFDKDKFMSDGSDDNSFKDHLFDIIYQKDLDNTTVWKRANMNRKSFSKIQCGETKIPKKTTVLALCIALELSLNEAKDLLASADMAFNPSDKRDCLVMECLVKEQYNIHEINAMLYVCNLPEF